jgi:competence protein ComEA
VTSVAHMSIRERLDARSRGELAGLALVVVATLAGAGLWYARSLPKPIQVGETPAPSVAAPSASGGAVAVSGSVEPSASATLVVDVAGWVRRPGVYEFPPGARVIDAVDRAGGARGGADLALLNLAAPLTDGQQILVPKRGQATGSGTGTVGTGVPAGPINVNTADATTLESLSGIGEVLAAAIVQYREEHGPFTSVDQLEDVPGIGPATLEDIRDQVTV